MDPLLIDIVPLVNAVVGEKEILLLNSETIGSRSPVTDQFNITIKLFRD